MADELIHDELATVYLICPRKGWYYSDDLDGWTEVAWERFTNVECGIYTKPLEYLTTKDQDFVGRHSAIPEGWIEPSNDVPVTMQIPAVDREALHETAAEAMRWTIFGWLQTEAPESMTLGDIRVLEKSIIATQEKTINKILGR